MCMYILKIKSLFHSHIRSRTKSNFCFLTKDDKEKYGIIILLLSLICSVSLPLNFNFFHHNYLIKNQLSRQPRGVKTKLNDMELKLSFDDVTKSNIFKNKVFFIEL